MAASHLDHLHPDQAQDPLREPLVPANPSSEETSSFDNNNNNNNRNSDSATNDNDSKNIIVRCPAGCSNHPDKVLLNMNHNVLLELMLCVTYGMSDSLWTGTVLAAYLKKLGQQQDRSLASMILLFAVSFRQQRIVRNNSSNNSTNNNNKREGNTYVGDIEAVSGLASLLSALPVGYLADTLPGGRSVVLKCGGLLLGVTAVVNALLFEWIGTGGNSSEKDDSFVPPPHTELYLMIIMALWGVGGGIVNGPAQALFADSTPQGKRSQYYMYLFVCYEVASCLGPLVSIVLFQALGDEWDLEDLRIVMYVGLAMEVVNGILMMFFDDSKALDEQVIEGESNDDQGNNPPPAIATTTTTEEPALDDEEQPDASDDNNINNNQTIVDASAPLSQTKWAWTVPIIVFVHSLVFALGSGMTVKFFPLFFKDQVGMSPTQVQVVYLILPLVLAGCGGIGQTIASRGSLGRVGTALLFKILGVSGLYSMVVFKEYLNKHALLLVPIYILRTALMNASYPLEESILMDYVPKNQRGRWKSLESIAAFGWCGSAALGGWTSDHAHGDYTYTFRITAAIQSLGILTWALLLPLVPRREDSFENTPEEGEDGGASLAEEGASNEGNPYGSSNDQSTLQEPLLSENTTE